MHSLVKGEFILVNHVKGELRFSFVQGKLSLVKGKNSSLSRKTREDTVLVVVGFPCHEPAGEGPYAYP